MAPRVPSLVSGINVYALPLSTKEGFVLSRIDGASSVEDISMMVGFKADEVVGILERLAELGAVRLSWPPSKRNAVVPTVAQPSRLQPTAASTPNEKPLYAARELDEKAQIPQDVKKRILQAYYKMESQNYYEVLGVAR